MTIIVGGSILQERKVRTKYNYHWGPSRLDLGFGRENSIRLRTGIDNFFGDKNEDSSCRGEMGTLHKVSC